MEIITSTTDTIPGKKVVKILGIVRGNTIRARHIGRDIMAGFKNIVGGEIEGVDIGADAVINVRFTTSVVMQGASEILAYGTAVKLG